MTLQGSTIEYRNWIRKKGPIHKIDVNDKHKDKTWKKNLNSIRETFIESYIRSGLIPEYMITRNYYYDVYSRNKVINDNKRVSNVLGDLFNPRDSKEYRLGVTHFIERHKDSFEKNEDNEWVVKLGSFHVHTLVSGIDDKVITRPNRKLKKLIKRVFDHKVVPRSFYETQWGSTFVKKCLIENALRDPERCSFIGHSKNSLDIQSTEEYAGYDGYTGWKGMVSYVTKNMYNIDNIDEVFDFDNNKLLRIT